MLVTSDMKILNPIFHFMYLYLLRWLLRRRNYSDFLGNVLYFQFKKKRYKNNNNNIWKQKSQFPREVKFGPYP